MRCLKISAAAALMVCLTGPALSAGNTDPDWPCVQRKIPALSAGMMWAGPPVDEKAEKVWSADDELGALVARISARRTTLDEAATQIAAYAGGLDAHSKPVKLVALFAGVLSTINSERAQIMKGITKFTRKQQELANAIRTTRKEFTQALKVKPKTDESRKAVRELERKLSWQSRIHQDRERSLRFVCESPVILEQRAFALAREVANQLSE
ncbi:MAG: hypothetical protein GY948_06320 [Alphaproteobacteria bacterium]|nr:hypothetical protein [Alphaproteobacteria bacterium]